MFEHTLNIACIASHTKHVAIVVLFKVLWQSVQDPIERQVTSAWSRRVYRATVKTLPKHRLCLLTLGNCLPSRILSNFLLAHGVAAAY